MAVFGFYWIFEDKYLKPNPWLISKNKGCPKFLGPLCMKSSRLIKITLINQFSKVPLYIAFTDRLCYELNMPSMNFKDGFYSTTYYFITYRDSTGSANAPILNYN
jgi:hypothetical protein